MEGLSERALRLSVSSYQRHCILDQILAIQQQEQLDDRIAALDRRKDQRALIEQLLKDHMEILLAPRPSPEGNFDSIGKSLEGLERQHLSFTLQLKKALEFVALLSNVILEDDSQADPELLEMVLKLITKVETDISQRSLLLDELAPLTQREPAAEGSPSVIKTSSRTSRRSSLQGSRPGSPQTTTPTITDSYLGLKEFKTAHSLSLSGPADRADRMQPEGRRSSVPNIKRSNSASLKKARKGNKPGEKQELSTLARKMAQASSGEAADPQRQSQPQKRLSERSGGEKEEEEEVPEYFERDQDGELSKYLFSNFNRQEEALVHRDSEIDPSQKPPPPTAGKERTLLPSLEGTFKAIGLDFVLGDTAKTAPPPKRNSKRGSTEPLAERILVGNPIKVESLFTSYTLYTITLEKRANLKVVVHRRYTDFERLDDMLRREHELRPNPQIRSLPDLPEKKVLGKFKASFIEQRRCGLEEYLTFIVKNQELSSMPFVREWFVSEYHNAE